MPSGTGSSGVDSDGVLRFATNLLDVPADVISLIYSRRWPIKIFFRFFKQVLGCRHLISRDQNGIDVQTSCAIIACMLIALWTGKMPTLGTYEMICFYFTGLADEDELMAHVEKLKISEIAAGQSFEIAFVTQCWAVGRTRQRLKNSQRFSCYCISRTSPENWS